MSRSRYPEVKWLPDGKPGCRGCGGPIPKRRYSWCSTACYKKYDPDHVCRRVWKRDEGKCQMCGGAIEAMCKDHDERSRAYYENSWKVAPLDERGHKRRPARFPDIRPDAEYDHIIPFSEGGETVDENMRLLCARCHRKRTAEWRGQKARERKGAGFQLGLALAALED